MARRIAAENYDAGTALRMKIAKGGVGENMVFTSKLTTDATRTPEMAEQMRANITANMDGFDQIAKQINSGDLVGALAGKKRAKQISMMDDPRDVAGIASRWKSTWNTWDEVWINGLLSSPSTFVVCNRCGR